MRKYWLWIMLLLGGCAGQPPSGPASLQDPNFAIRQRILRTAEDLLGVPYAWGGATPQGMDCSGLVQYAYARAGVTVPRTTVELYRLGQPLDRVQPGDLLFFRTGLAGVSHVGIYAGNDQMIHVSSGSGQVRKVTLNLPYWRERLVSGATFLACRAPC